MKPNMKIDEQTLEKMLDAVAAQGHVQRRVKEDLASIRRTRSAFRHFTVACLVVISVNIITLRLTPDKFCTEIYSSQCSTLQVYNTTRQVLHLA